MSHQERPYKNACYLINLILDKIFREADMEVQFYSPQTEETQSSHEF